MIPEILTPERLAAYIDMPFNLTALTLKKPDIALKDEERALLIPLVNKYLPILLRSTGSPEWAAFAMFVLMYGTRLGLSQWLLPLIAGSSEADASTAASAAAPSR